MLKLEPPRLGLKTHRAPLGNWVQQGRSDNDKVLALAPIDGTIYYPAAARIHSWDLLTSHQTDVAMPSATFDVVFLNRVFERYDHEHRKKLLTDCARMVVPGGTIMSIDGACNDAQEVFDLVKSIGFDLTDFVKRRLNNKDIIMMKPSEAAFFSSMVAIPNRKRLAKYLHELGFEQAKLENLWCACERFPISRLSVGMKWFKQK